MTHDISGAAERHAGKSPLAVEGLEVAFTTDSGLVKAIDRVSFNLTPGKTLALVGESGSGKSVTAFSIMRLLPNAARVLGGAVRFDSADLLTTKTEDMRRYRGKRIGMIFQEPMTALNPVYRVGDQIAEVLQIHFGTDRDKALVKAIEMLERVGIPDAPARAHAYPHQLSGGMRQRVMTAMALICEPDILIADEPTTALDVTIQAQILDLIMDMQAQMGMAILFITHDLAVVSEFADEVMVMYAGRIVEHAPTERLFADPKHPYTRGLIETLPVSGRHRERLPTIPGQVPSLAALPPGCRYSNRCPLADDDCRRAEPDLLAMGDGRTAACWKAEP
jgi:oligopeptide/dipeptide ABC transporter ATP-binding protein